MTHRLAIICPLVWLLLVASLGARDEWPQWRGPRRDAQVLGVKTPASWPKQLDKLWQVEVGVGHASPIVSDRKVYVFSRRGEDEVLACLDLGDGKQRWQQAYPAPYEVNSVAAVHGKGPKSTPAVAGGRVFAYGISGILTCWDANSGKQIWQRRFSKRFKSTAPLYGTAMSPLVVDDKCIVHLGGHDKGALVALDVKTGEILWSATEDGPAYASPILVTIADVRQVVTQTQKACLGVSLDEGRVLWQIPFQTEYDQNSVTPVEYEGSLIFSGYNKGIDRFRIEHQDDEWQTDIVWNTKEVELYMSSPVVDGERLFGFSHRHKGQFFAIDLTTGKTLWTSDGRMGENAALVRSGKVLWALTTAGELIVLAASDQHFEPLARYHVADTPTWAHPAITNSGILIKDESKLTLWKVGK